MIWLGNMSSKISAMMSGINMTKLTMRLTLGTLATLANIFFYTTSNSHQSLV